MILLSKVDRYIGQVVLVGTALVLMVIFLLMSFVDFVDGLKDIGKANFGIWQHIQFVLLSQPKNLFLLLPATALVGSTIGLSYLAANSELIAMRAAGISVWRIGTSVIKTGIIFIIAGFLMGEYVVPVTEDMAHQGRAESLGIVFAKKIYSRVWLRQDQEFINILEVLPDKSLLRVNIYSFDENMRLQRHIEAMQAIYIDGSWELERASISEIDGDQVRASLRAKYEWKTSLTPDVLSVFTVKPDSLSLLQLHRYIKHLQRNRQQTSNYELVFWRKLFSPLAIAIMLLLAIPFVFAPLRSANMGQRVFIGILVALAFYMVNLSFGSFAIISQWPPLVGAAAPPLIFLGLVFWLFRRVA